MSPNYAHDRISAVQHAATNLGDARTHEMRLEDARPIVKMEAVKRIMERDGIAATPAEKIVETDALYTAHRERQYTAVRETQSAWGAFEAAKLTALLAVEQYRATMATVGVE